MGKKRKIISRSILVATLGVLGLTGLGYMYTVRDEPLTPVATMTAEDYESKRDNATYGNDIEQVDGSKFAEAKEKYYEIVEKQGIGSVYVPSSNIALPILAGDDEYALMTGLGTPSPTQRLGKGLFIGMSHSMTNRVLLDNILNTKIGGEVYTTDYKKVYIYRADEVKVVNKYDSKYLEEPKKDEKAKILLYRCEGGIGTLKRAILYGDFVEAKEFKDVPKDVLVALGILGKNEEEVKPLVVSKQEEVKDEKSKNIKVKERNSFEKLCMWLYKALEQHTVYYVGVVLLLLVLMLIV